MKNKKIKRSVKIALIVVVACIFCGFFYYFTSPLFSAEYHAKINQTSETSLENTHIPTEQEIEFKKNKAVNADYIGRLTFQSGLIDQLVVKGEDNAKYLNTTWDLKNDKYGAVFMDYRNNTSDQNMILYGHYIYGDATHMFSPLEKLTDSANYDNNKIFTLKLDDNELRTYQITDVFFYEVGNTSMEYYYVGYSDAYFNEYYATVKNADLYQTGISLTNKDKWVTLQTCVENHDELREIVLAKQIS